jgi:hypothetical protein
VRFVAAPTFSEPSGSHPRSGYPARSELITESVENVANVKDVALKMLRGK